jgi:4-diphosphocytidyl-2-C-methyl-D-erythritol kinase
MNELRENAPAKINLALHVTGRREDGYHLLDTLVTFADRGDVITVRDAAHDQFTLSGPFADLLQSEDTANNLVTKARDALRKALLSVGKSAPPVAIHLEKNLPIASGIGGGSADAAATLRALLRLWDGEIDPSTLNVIALQLGADVPMCLHSTPLRATGIGGDVAPVPALPSFGLVLGNPLKSVSTPAIFKAMTQRNNPAIAALPTSNSQSAWLAALDTMRNDLEPVARHLCPEIAEVSRLIADTGADLVRMSGSGATCFGLYASFEKAEKAVEMLRAIQPDWYFQAAKSVSEV